MYCVTWSPMSVIWWRSKVSDQFYLYFCFLWLLSLAGKWLCVFLWQGSDLTCCAFAVKPFWNWTLVGLTTSLSLKRCKKLLCLRNFNYEISVVLNLEPCTFTGCCHIDPVSGIQAIRSFNVFITICVLAEMPSGTCDLSYALITNLYSICKYENG